MTEDLVILKLNEIWECDIPFGWIPITGDKKILNTEIYQSRHFDENILNLAELLKSVYNVTELFEVEEGGRVTLKNSADCYFSYTGLEHLYTDKDFRFVIYFSHESSVTVGGKDLLNFIRNNWPDYKNHIWTSPFYD